MLTGRHGVQNSDTPGCLLRAASPPYIYLFLGLSLYSFGLFVYRKALRHASRGAFVLAVSLAETNPEGYGMIRIYGTGPECPECV